MSFSFDSLKCSYSIFKTRVEELTLVPCMRPQILSSNGAVDVNPSRTYSLSISQCGLGRIFALTTFSAILLPFDGRISQLQCLTPFCKIIVPDDAVSVELQGVARIEGRRVLALLGIIYCCIK